MVRLHQHAKERLIERGTTESEITATVEQGEIFPAKYERTGFRRNFRFNDLWRDKHDGFVKNLFTGHCEERSDEAIS